MDIDRKDYKGTPFGYPMGNSIKKEDELYSKKKYPYAYPHYDDDNFYLPMVLGKGNVVYLIIDKYCIMDALKHWKFIKEGESN